MLKVEKYVNDDGEFRCFGFENLFCRKKDVRKILETIPQIHITYFSTAPFVEIFCKFSFKGNNFDVCEPFGDNSFYDISCTTPDTPELTYLYQLFCSHDITHKIDRNNKIRVIFWVAIMILMFSFSFTTFYSNLVF